MAFGAQETREKLLLLHDCTVLDIRFIGSSERCVEVALRCPVDLGDETLNGRDIVVTMVDVFASRYSQWTNGVPESVDNFQFEVAEQWKREFPSVPVTTEVPVVFTSGSLLETICERVELAVGNERQR